jgi:hypothetical protein
MGARISRERGISMVEIAVGLALVATASGLIATAVSRASRVASASLLQSRLSEDARRLATELSGDLRRSGADRSPGDGEGSELAVGGSLSFRVATGFDEAASVPTWSAAPVVYALALEERETANGRDDDGDGLVDEGALLRDGRILATGVVAFTATLLGDGVDDDGDGLLDDLDELLNGPPEKPPTGVAVRFTLAGSAGGEVLRHETVISVSFRN